MRGKERSACTAWRMVHFSVGKLIKCICWANRPQESTTEKSAIWWYHNIAILKFHKIALSHHCALQYRNIITPHCRFQVYGALMGFMFLLSKESLEKSISQEWNMEKDYWSMHLFINCAAKYEQRWWWVSFESVSLPGNHTKHEFMEAIENAEY